MIKEIRIEGMKGTNTTQELTGRDLILGRNGAGKTTRMQAMSLVMNGYVPGRGKTAAEIFKMASEDTMTVGLATENFEATRSYVKSSKVGKTGEQEVTISQKVYISPSQGETTIKQKESRIKEELGDFPVMLDFGAFTEMTDSQKRDFIYGLSGHASEWDREKIEKVLRERSGVADTIAPEFEEILENDIQETMHQYKSNITVQDGLLAMSEYAKDQLKHWKKEKLNSEGAARKLTELKNKSQETDRDLGANEAKLADLNAKKDEITARIAEQATINQTIEEKISESERLTEEISRLSASENEERIKELQETIADLEKIIDDYNEEEYERTIEDLNSRKCQTTEDIKRNEDQMLQVKDQLAEINAEIKAQTTLLEQVEGMNGCCAFNPGLPCNQDFSDFIAKINETLDDAYEKKDETEAAIKNLKEIVDNFKSEHSKLEEEINQVENARKDRAHAHHQNLVKFAELKDELAALNNREPEIKAKRDRIAQISAELDGQEKVDLTDLEAEKQALSGEIAALSQTIDEQKRFRNDLIHIKENVIDGKTADLQVQAWKNISDAIGQKGVKGEMVKEMLAPMKETIDQKIKDMGIYNEVFFETESETGREVFTFGFEDPGASGHRPFEALSTGEQLLFTTAMLTAIIERSNAPIKILALDNINHLDSNNLHIILTGLPKMGAAMDNIILCGVAEPDEADLEGWTVHQLK